MSSTLLTKLQTLWRFFFHSQNVWIPNHSVPHNENRISFMLLTFSLSAEALSVGQGFVICCEITLSPAWLTWIATCSWFLYLFCFFFIYAVNYITEYRTTAWFNYVAIKWGKGADLRLFKCKILFPITIWPPCGNCPGLQAYLLPMILWYHCHICILEYQQSW